MDKQNEPTDRPKKRRLSLDISSKKSARVAEMYDRYILDHPGVMPTWVVLTALDFFLTDRGCDKKRRKPAA